MTKKEKTETIPEVRIKPFFQNYDYTDEVEPSETSPGGGFYHGKMDRFKSVDEFFDKKRQKKIKEAYLTILDHLKK